MVNLLPSVCPKGLRSVPLPRACHPRSIRAFESFRKAYQGSSEVNLTPSVSLGK